MLSHSSYDDLGGPDDHVEDYKVWCASNNLDQECVEALLSLSPEHREAVVIGFAPKAGTRNPSGLFRSYVKSMASGPKDDPWQKASPAQAPASLGGRGHGPQHGLLHGPKVLPAALSTQS